MIEFEDIHAASLTRYLNESKHAASLIRQLTIFDDQMLLTRH